MPRNHSQILRDYLELNQTLEKVLMLGEYRGTRIIHDHLKEKGIFISRKQLLAWLHEHAEPGNYVSIGGIRQKSWIM
jgi:hypothetical protein